MRNIILIGMPASGKSTAGVVLAKVLGCDFIDTDLLVQNREGRRLEELIREKGIERFLDIECEVCRTLQAENTVIATGGSVIYREPAIRHLKELGAMVYLSVDFETLRNRLYNVMERGVVLRDGQTLKDLYRERTALYERYADIIVEEGSQTLEETVSAVKAALEMRGMI